MRPATAAVVTLALVACGNEPVAYPAGKIFATADLPRLVLQAADAPTGTERSTPAPVSLGELARRRSEEVPPDAEPPDTEREERLLRARLRRGEERRLRTLGFLGAFETSFRTKGLAVLGEDPGVFVGSSVRLFRRPEAASAAVGDERERRRARIREELELEEAVGLPPPSDPGEPDDRPAEVPLDYGEESFGVERAGATSFQFSYLWRVGNAVFFLDGDGVGDERLDRARARALLERALARAH